MELTHPHFTKRTISEKGKQREIWEPSDRARQIHKHLAKQVCDAYLKPVVPFLDINLMALSAKGGLPGTSATDVVRHHAARNGYHFFFTDLSHAYDSVNPARLGRQLADLKIFDSGERAYDTLREYFVHPSSDGLLQGGPASPILFNVYCADLDQRLREISYEYGLSYARYMDDLSFSAQRNGGPIGKRKRRKIFEAITEDGWDIAHHKTRVESLPTPVTMLGISYYKTGYWQMSPTLVNKIVDALDSLEAKLDSGETPTDHDIGVIDGYHGVITSTHDDRRGQPTPLEARLIQRYKNLRQRTMPLLGECAVVGADTL